MDLAQFNASVHPSLSSPVSRADAMEAIYATGYWLLADERVAEAAMVFRTMIQGEPRDERGWLGLGECHERIDQPRIAAQLYGAASVIVTRSMRCLVARARVLSKLGEVREAEYLLDLVEQSPETRDEPELAELVASERAIARSRAR